MKTYSEASKRAYELWPQSQNPEAEKDYAHLRTAFILGTIWSAEETEPNNVPTTKRKLDPSNYCVKDCGFSVRTYNKLMMICDGNTRIDELYKLVSNSNILALPGCGRRMYNEAWSKLEEFGFHFSRPASGFWNWDEEQKKYIFKPLP